MPVDRSEVVIDANVAIGLAAAARLADFAARHVLVAPPIFWSEVRSALHAEGHRGGRSTDAVRDLFAAILDTGIEPVGVCDPWAAWQIADQHSWSKTYDAEYLALAVERGCALATIDRQLVRVLADHDVPLARIA